MHQISVPISVRTSKKKSFLLNLNAYRNAHFHVLDKAKKVFKEEVSELISKLPIMQGVKLTFTLYMKTTRSADLSNVCSIVDKFFCDALVELGKLPDDDFDHIGSVDYRFGGIDSTNPRVDITLEPIEKEETMQITINQNEIEQAITDYVKSQVTINDNQKVDIDLKATRGAEGFQAIIEISAVEQKRPATRAGRPPKAQATETSEETTTESPVVQSEVATDVVAEESLASYENAVEETAASEPVNEEATAPSVKKSIFGSN